MNIGICRNFASAPFTIITYDRTVRYGSPEQATGSGEAVQSATAPAPERSRSSRWDVQPVRRALAGLSSRRQPPEAAASGTRHPEVVQARLAVLRQPAQPSAGAAEAADRHDDRDNSSNAASQSAELRALRSRAMQSIHASSSTVQAGSQRRRKRTRSASKSPDGRRRRWRRCCRSSVQPAEPHRRKRHVRRHTPLQEQEIEARQPAAAEAASVPAGEADNERWEMD
jgi:hypothetical protein